ncbi:YjfK family protein [Vibrio mangrovi]|uniref:YjfK family protein n=1 Tax=Vibrio mangrovi TaxID=474394 RepID=A0A1Y6IQW5_9VIBR|nr:YjfK family protein [Vibrio mangrovi]MDW6004309.1 YjfK family protein [Vibrio mangrovi]SMR98892.1 hypothetical protein VIM7927_00105 [Vibrio mangrovi]
MFSWLKKKTDSQSSTPAAPEVLGLRLGGAFEFEPLKLKLIEPELIVEGVSSTQLIQAVGEVKLDAQTRLLRFYTDDDGYVQVLQEGDQDSDVREVKMFYYYDTSPVDTETQWQKLLENGIVKTDWSLEEHHFHKAWDNIVPVAMTEKTWHKDGSVTETDQFVMVYERETESGYFEGLMVAGEEVITQNHAEHCLVLSTYFELNPTDFKIIG